MAFLPATITTRSVSHSRRSTEAASRKLHAHQFALEKKNSIRTCLQSLWKKIKCTSHLATPKLCSGEKKKKNEILNITTQQHNIKAEIRNFPNAGPTHTVRRHYVDKLVEGAPSNTRGLTIACPPTRRNKKKIIKKLHHHLHAIQCF